MLRCQTEVSLIPWLQCIVDILLEQGQRKRYVTQEEKECYTHNHNQNFRLSNPTTILETFLTSSYLPTHARRESTGSLHLVRIKIRIEEMIIRFDTLQAFRFKV